MNSNASTQLARALLRTPIKNIATRNSSVCPPVTVKAEPAPAFKEPANVPIKAVPYRAIPDVCLRRPLIITPRADDVFGPLKNHQRPYKPYFCDSARPALVLPKYEHIQCTIEHMPRRGRKTVSATSTCTKESKCETKGDIDGCRKLTCPGCGVARVQSKFPEERTVDWCYRIEAPTPSFHECVRSAIPDLTPDECHCLTDRGPPCEPVAQRPTLANR